MSPNLASRTTPSWLWQHVVACVANTARSVLFATPLAIYRSVEGKKRCRTESLRIFEFSTRILLRKNAPSLFPNFLRLSVLCFLGNGTTKFPPFFNAKSPAELTEKNARVLWRAGKVIGAPRVARMKKAPFQPGGQKDPLEHFLHF